MFKILLKRTKAKTKRKSIQQWKSSSSQSNRSIKEFINRKPDNRRIQKEINKSQEEDESGFNLLELKQKIIKLPPIWINKIFTILENNSNAINSNELNGDNRKESNSTYHNYCLDEMEDVSNNNNEIMNEKENNDKLLPFWVKSPNTPNQLELDLRVVSAENLDRINKFCTAVIQKYDEILSDKGIALFNFK